MSSEAVITFEAIEVRAYRKIGSGDVVVCVNSRDRCLVRVTVSPEGELGLTAPETTATVVPLRGIRGRGKREA